MARIGYLMLREGKWEDKQVISAPWVKEITSAVTPKSEMNPSRPSRDLFEYGYIIGIIIGFILSLIFLAFIFLKYGGGNSYL